MAGQHGLKCYLTLNHAEKPTVKTLQHWCDRFLDEKQWKQLQAVIRSARRDPSRYRTVRLSRNAHEILGKLAMRDKLTLSKVVERYLSCVAHTPAKARLIKKITLPDFVVHSFCPPMEEAMS